MRGYLQLLNNHLLPAFGEQKLTSITNNQIAQWVSKSVSNGVGLVIIKRSHNVLRQVCNSALLDGRISRNPAIGVPLPRTKSKEQRPLTINQLQLLAKECGPYESLVLFAGTTGLRW